MTFVDAHGVWVTQTGNREDSCVKPQPSCKVQRSHSVRPRISVSTCITWRLGDLRVFVLSHLIRMEVRGFRILECLRSVSKQTSSSILQPYRCGGNLPRSIPSLNSSLQPVDFCRPAPSRPRFFSNHSRSAEGQRSPLNNTASGDQTGYSKKPRDEAVNEAKDKAIRAPWHRDGAEAPPAEQRPSSRVLTKGQ